MNAAAYIATGAAAVVGADSAVHTDAVALWLIVILLAARLGGDLAGGIGRPAVLGKLIVGVVLGNLALAGLSGLEPIKTDPFVDMFARVGVLILLLEVGFESTFGQMLKAGWSSLSAACLGVIAPFVLGWGVAAWLLPDRRMLVHTLLGVVLTAASIGITACVLKTLGHSQRDEARLTRGAAVIDDVLGLLILVVGTSIIVAADVGGSVSASGIAAEFGVAGGFLIGSLVVGMLSSKQILSLASMLRNRRVLVVCGISFCFFLSWLANLVGLAPIVVAFAAGFILEDVHYRDFIACVEYGLEKLIHPISALLLAVYLALMGLRIDLTSFAQPEVLGWACALTIAAIVAKQVCSRDVLGKGINRLTDWLGMVLRGEVGLILINIGVALTVSGVYIIAGATFPAVVAMGIVTTMVTPLAFRWSLGRAVNRVQSMDAPRGRP